MVSLSLFLLLFYFLFYGRIGDDGLFSRDTSPPLVPVVFLQYMKPSLKPSHCASLPGVTRSLVWVGSGVASFTHRHKTAADCSRTHVFRSF